MHLEQWCMEALLYELFSESEKSSIKTLEQDDSSRILLYKEAAKRLMVSDIIGGHSKDQLLLITALSPFASDEEECIEVANILYWGIKVIDIRPFITEHNGAEFAYRALICLSLFKRMLINKHERRAAPSPDYIRMTGISNFKLIGQDDIAEHFCKWEAFLSEQLMP